MCVVNELGRSDSIGIDAVEKLITEMCDTDQKTEGVHPSLQGTRN
jgi:hypothetical protein